VLPRGPSGPLSLTAGGAGRQRPAADLLELRLGRHLLGDQGRLDALEQPSSQPTSWAWAMRSSTVGGHRLVGEGPGQAPQLVAQLGGQAALELGDGRGVDLAQPHAGRLVERRAAHLLEELLDHAADAHDLRRLLDQVGDGRGPSPSSDWGCWTAIPSGPTTTIWPESGTIWPCCGVSAACCSLIAPSSPEPGDGSPPGRRRRLRATGANRWTARLPLGQAGAP
jgi:hypothetical protein